MPSSLPGFGTKLRIGNRVLSVQQIHVFSGTAVNEIRVGYNFVRHDEDPQESLDDAAIGMQPHNTPKNVPLRAPFQGVDTAFFNLNESRAQSTYHFAANNSETAILRRALVLCRLHIFAVDRQHLQPGRRSKL